ncbi:5917_t:CDS:2 [Cetraspora pellucida]|uniref:5917_t:CDS:1 n=1 Tax=Cetraspora pellucida TaxID=1433469 RepID=A0A9N9J091_9GLOM|nr:5917_t:CDS:2 [Cetraspora pellucida]
MNPKTLILFLVVVFFGGLIPYINGHPAPAPVPDPKRDCPTPAPFCDADDDQVGLVISSNSHEGFAETFLITVTISNKNSNI